MSGGWEHCLITHFGSSVSGNELFPIMDLRNQFPKAEQTSMNDLLVVPGSDGTTSYPFKQRYNAFACRNAKQWTLITCRQYCNDHYWWKDSQSSTP